MQSNPNPSPPTPFPYKVVVVVGESSVEAGVLDPGSQIVAIRQGLAEQVGARVNEKIKVEMEGANGASWTLGCAENASVKFILKFTLMSYATPLSVSF